jgi:hypothetical protein
MNGLLKNFKLRHYQKMILANSKTPLFTFGWRNPLKRDFTTIIKKGAPQKRSKLSLPYTSKNEKEIETIEKALIEKYKPS